MSVDHLPYFFEQPVGRPKIWVHSTKEDADNVSSMNIGGNNYRKIIFFPRNTLPLTTNGDKARLIFINNPPWIGPDATSRFSHYLKGDVQVISEAPPKAYRPNAGEELYIESYPTSLTTAALTLNPDNHVLRSLDRKFRQTLKPAEYAEFIDLILAGKYIDKDGNTKDAPDFEGEYLMLAALIGHGESAAELVRRRVVFDAEFSANSEAEFNPEAKSPNGIGFKDLVAVHATEYLPYQDAGGVFIRSIFDGSMSKVPDPVLILHLIIM